MDHGKTALVKSLTGTDTDRFPEEQERGISIDIGFAQLDLPGGRPAALIDVPGHERFVRNMLAGASGIDVVMLVIAADEGIMPQTREHFEIVRLLGVDRGLVVVTKADLVDEEWLELVVEDIRDWTRGTFLEGAPIIPTSAVTGAGLEELRSQLAQLSLAARSKQLASPARLPVDRVFTVAGFGTVVTGTLISGRISLEDRLELLPPGRVARVRGIQVHGARRDEAVAGQRVALNLAGIDVDQVERGMVLMPPGLTEPSVSLGGRLQLLPSAQRPLANGARVHLHSGAAEVLARVYLLDRRELAPGDSALVRMKVEEPLVIARGDRYIIRSYSPVATIGGGIIIDSHMPFQGRRRQELAAALARRESGDPGDLLQQQLEAAGLAGASLGPQLAAVVGVGETELRQAATKLETSGRALRLAPGQLVASRLVQSAAEELRAYLSTYHQRYPLRQGPSKEELRTGVLKGLEPRVYAGFINHLTGIGAIVLVGDRVSLPGHQVVLSPALARQADCYERAIREGGYSPPEAAEVVTRCGGSQAEELWAYLTESGRLASLGQGRYFHREVVAEAEEQLRALAAASGGVTVAGFRDLVGTSRKHALALLEYFDAQGLTRRVGDQRVLVRR